MDAYNTFSREKLSSFKTLAEQCRYLLSCKITTAASGNTLQARVGDFALPVFCNGDEHQTKQKAVYWLKTQAANYLNAAKGV